MYVSRLIMIVCGTLIVILPNFRVFVLQSRQYYCGVFHLKISRFK